MKLSLAEQEGLGGGQGGSGAPRAGFGQARLETPLR